MFCQCHLPQILYYPHLWVDPVVEYCASPASPAALPCSKSVSVRFPMSLILLCWPLHPHRCRSDPFPSLHLLLESPKLCQSSQLHFLDCGRIAVVQEHLHTFMDTIHEISPKKRIPSLPSAPNVRRRFSKCSANVIFPRFSIIRICGLIPWLNIVPPPPPPPLCLAPNPFPSDFRCPSSFYAGRSTHTGVEVIHFPLSTFFWSPPNSVRAPNSTSSIAVVLQ